MADNSDDDQLHEVSDAELESMISNEMIKMIMQN